VECVEGTVAGATHLQVPHENCLYATFTQAVRWARVSCIYNRCVWKAETALKPSTGQLVY